MGIRQKFNERVRKGGNEVYDGLGDFLTQDVDLKKATIAGLAALALTGGVGLSGGCTEGFKRQVWDNIYEDAGRFTDHAYFLDIKVHGWVNIDVSDSDGIKKAEIIDEEGRVLMDLSKEFNLYGQDKFEINITHNYLINHGIDLTKEYFLRIEDRNGNATVVPKGSL